MKAAPLRLFWTGACLMALVPLGEAVGESCIVQRDGSQGKCKSLYDCAQAVADFRKNIRPTICNRDEQTVCCSDGRRAPGGKRISELKCDKYKSLVTEELEAIPLLLEPEPVVTKVSKCIQSSTPLITGGEEASPGEFPHMVAVGFQASGVNGIQWDCGGTLISERFVVTAAHCSFSRQYGTEPSVCRLGAHNLARREGTAQDVNINRVILHPSYTLTNKYNDIALLELVKNVKFDDNIRPACLWQRDDIDRPNAVAIGWGRIGDFGEKSDVLMKALLDLVESSRCREKIRPTKQIPQGLVDNQLCAGGGKNDTCRGDSGGPLTITSEENGCVFYLVAVTSFGYKCEKGSPGVYSRISSYLPWIESQVWPDS